MPTATLTPKQRQVLELMLEKKRRARSRTTRGGSAPPAPRSVELIPRRSPEAVSLLSFVQQRLWFIQQLHMEYVAPRSPAEETIAELWGEMLEVGRVGVHDPFLELGGDSLLASRLVARLREDFDLDLPIRLFFEASTVAEPAKAVEKLREEEELAALVRQVGQM